MSVQKASLIAASVGLFFSSIAAAETPLYAVLMQSLSNPFWSAAELGAKTSAHDAQVDYYLQTVESEQSAEPQLEACNSMLERRPSVMLAAAINPTNLLPCLQRAKELKVPVVDLGGTLDNDATKDAGIEIAFSILSDNRTAGMQAADHIAKSLDADASQVLVLTPATDNSIASQRTEGFTQQLMQTAPDVEIIQSVVNSDRKSVSSIVSEAINNHSNLKAIFAVNDVIAIDAAETARIAGNSIIVVGADGTPGAIELIKAGTLNASVSSLPYLVGKQAIEVASQVLDGDSTEKVILVPTVVLTKELLDQGTDPMLAYVK